MIAWLNDRWVPAEEATVSAFDRGFLYGDGLFETLCVKNQMPFRWGQHWARLERGAAMLRMKLPFDSAAGLTILHELLARNGMTHAVARLHVSRGVGERGYSLPPASRHTVLFSLHPPRQSAPGAGWKLHTAAIRASAGDPLASVKTANKLPQILARAEAEEHGCEEALLLNAAGDVVEASAANLFFVAGGSVLTPSLESGALPGITRSVVIELCRSAGIPCEERRVPPEQLGRADAAFLTLSTLGIVPVDAIDAHRYPGSPLVFRLASLYDDLVQRETAGV